MNRAARIVAVGGSGQVLASNEVWNRCRSLPSCATMTATSLGTLKLRGIQEGVEVRL